MSRPGFRIKVLEALGRLQPGDVYSYGDLAAAAGFPGAARGAGAVLAGSGGDVAWWRVVYADGRLVPGHEADQAARLQAEGVEVHHGRVAAFKDAPRRLPRGEPGEAPPTR